MKRAGFEYEVKAGITLTRPELDVLVDLAGNHYDAVCRSTVRPGKDAFLNGMVNNFNFAEPPVDEVTIHLTFRQIDTLIKILEQRNFLSNVKSFDIAYALDTLFRDALDAINRERSRLDYQNHPQLTTSQIDGRALERVPLTMNRDTDDEC